MSWREIEIGEICEVGRGSSPRPISNKAYFENGNIPWVKIADATASGKYLYNTKEVVNSYGASYSRLLPVGSLILATSGVSLGQVKILGMEGCIHDGWLYLNNFKGVEKEYLYYCLLTLDRYFHSKSYGAAIQNINTDILRRTPIPFPPLEKQQKIASILSAYDDLIENNQKRIKLLDEAARNVYVEWFVNFRFPGHEKVEIIYGLPERWGRRVLGQVVSYIGRGVSPKYVETNGIVVLNQKCIRNESISFTHSRLTSLHTKVPPEKLLQEFDVLINSTGTGTLGRVAQIVDTSSQITVDTHITIVRANNEIISPIFLGYCIRHQQPFITGLGKGATNQIELSRSDLSDLVQIVIPDWHLQKAFEALVKPLLKQKSLLIKEINILKEARDILLPRLMNRTIEV